MAVASSVFHGCAMRDDSIKAESDFLIKVVRIVPSRSVFKIDGLEYKVGRREQQTISMVEGAVKLHEGCVLHVNMINNTNVDYVLSSWDVRSIFVSQMRMYDDEKDRWHFSNTFRHLHPETIVYDITCPKNTATKLTVHLGMTVFSRYDKESNTSRLPISVDYQLDDSSLLSARPIINGAICAPVLVSAAGVGVALITDDDFE